MATNKNNYNNLSKSFLNKNLATLENGTNLVLTDEHKARVDVSTIQGKGHYRLQRIDNPLLLIECRTQVRPCTKLKGAGFLPYIYESLTKMHISETFRIQSYSWPTLMTNESLILINPPKSGKTMSYLPVVCGYCLYDDIKAVNRYLSPTVLILAPTASDVDEIYNNLCRIDVKKKLRVIRAHQWLNKVVEIANGWDIVIGTPIVFSKLLGYQIVTSVKALDIIVLDNVNVDCKHVQEILNNCDLRIKNYQTQLIITSENFTQFHDVVLKRYDMNLLIGAHLESAIYGGIQFVFRVLPKEKKLIYLEYILKDTDYEKMVIICRNKDEVLLISKHLFLLSVPCLSVHEHTEHKEIETIYREWHRIDSSEILVCTDHTFPDLDITDANTLVHFSLPSTWTGFTHRFSTLINNLSRQNKKKCYSYHFLDEDTVKQLPKIISFVERLGLSVEENLKMLVEQEIEKQEYEKALSGIDLCDGLLLLGHCSNINSCNKRHKLTLYDEPRKHLPINGELKFKILQVLSVDHYICLIIGFRKPGQKEWQSVETEIFTCATCSLYYNNLKTTAVSAEPKLGQICAIDMGGGVYERCEIKQINISSKKTSLITANIELIDRGIKLEKINVSLLLELPEHLKQPSFIVSIRLSNIKPHDDSKWCDMANNLIRKIINLPIPDEEYFTGRIMFALKNNIWVDDICRGHTKSNFEVFTQSIKRQILDNDIGIPNKGHTEHLILLYKETKKYSKNIENKNNLDSDNKEIDNEPVQKPAKSDENTNTLLRKNATNVDNNMFDKKVEENESKIKASLLKRFLTWTKQKKYPETKIIPESIKLEIGKDYEAYLTVAYDDGNATFYVQLNENLETFNKLIKDIQEYMQNPNNIKILADAQIGDFCLVQCDNGIYNRAKILKLPSDKTEDFAKENNSNTATYSVYFIDYGDIEIIKNVYSIHNMFLSVAEQAIKCRLHNVKIDITVLEDVVSMLYEYSGVMWFLSVIDILEDGTCSVKVRKTTEGSTVNLNKKAAQYCKKAEELFQLSTAPKKDMNSVWNILAGLDDDSDCPEKIFQDLNELMILYGTHVEDRPMATITEIVDEFSNALVEESKNVKDCDIIQNLTNLTPVSNTPNVVWSQDEVEIMLKIQIPDVDVYTLRVSNRHIYFKTTVSTGNIYEFSINLFGPVVPAFTKHKALGPYVYVVCGKLLLRIWPNLYLGDHKLKFVAHDHDWKVLDFTERTKSRDIKYNSVEAIDPEDNGQCGDSDEIDLESDNDNELLDMMD